MTYQELVSWAGDPGFVEYANDVAGVTAIIARMGYDDLGEFRNETGAEPTDLIGCYWTIIGGRLLIADE